MYVYVYIYEADGLRRGKTATGAQPRLWGMLLTVARESVTLTACVKTENGINRPSDTINRTVTGDLTGTQVKVPLVGKSEIS